MLFEQGLIPGRRNDVISFLWVVWQLTLVFPGAVSVPGASPDLPGSSIKDPGNPDFSGVVDFSNAVPGPDGSWCITKIKYVDHMENDQVKECWHQNITQCHDTYITEFLPSQEQKCEETFWKSCKIDFKEMPFNYTLKHCHTPLIKKCDDFQSEYGSPPKTVCRTWFESECNTTYVESPSGAHKPNTWCQKKPRKICAPDNCNMVQGPEDCRDKVMVSTIQKPEEHCQLQPQRHCRLITKLVPHLTTKEVCKDIPKEICIMKLVNPHPVKKPIQLKWCTKKAPQADLPAYSPPSNYLPASPTPGGFRPPPQSSAQQQFKPNFRRDDTEPFIITVDGQQFNSLDELPEDLQKLTFPVGPPTREQFRPVRQGDEAPRFTRHVKTPMAFPHMKPGHNPDLHVAGSSSKVRIATNEKSVGSTPGRQNSLTEESISLKSTTQMDRRSSPAVTSATPPSSRSTLPSLPVPPTSFRPSQRFQTKNSSFGEATKTENPQPAKESIEPVENAPSGGSVGGKQNRLPRRLTGDPLAPSSLRGYPGSIL